ncbi:MAG: hypothetical protein U9Q72_00090 [Patescibacteria group bacterium]|nr:hypothetical protein [Patescibacteria group bacterium]
MLTKLGFAELIKVGGIKKHGNGGFAVLFTSQGEKPKHESWVCFSRSYLKHGKLDREGFQWWGSFRSPGWFKDATPGIPLFLIISELTDVLEEKLKNIF